MPATQWLHHEVATDQTCHLSHANDVMSREATMMQGTLPAAIIHSSGIPETEEADRHKDSRDMVAGCAISPYPSEAMSIIWVGKEKPPASHDGGGNVKLT